jgi:MFS family permease
MKLQKPVAVLIANFLGPLAGNMVLALVPTLKEEFQATAPEVLLSITFFMIPFAIFMLFSGTLSDIYDRKKTMALGFFIYAIGSVLCAMSPSLGFFLGSRTVQGIGYAFVMPVLLAIMGDIVPFETRGRWMGYMGASSTAGVAMGPLIAGVIAEVNWRFAFLFVALLTVVVATIFFLSFKGYIFRRGKARPRAVVGMLSKCIRVQAIYLLAITGFMTFLCYAASLAFISDTLSLPPPWAERCGDRHGNDRDRGSGNPCRAYWRKARRPHRSKAHRRAGLCGADHGHGRSVFIDHKLGLFGGPSRAGIRGAVRLVGTPDTYR